MAERRFSSKYSGRCKVCHQRIQRGTTIAWKREWGARHTGCDRRNQVDVTYSKCFVSLEEAKKTFGELADAWDAEHENDLTCVERMEGMLEPSSGWGLDPWSERDQETAWVYAQQDTPQNPWR